MAFTPDPETSWAAGFAGALANPGINLEMSSLIGKFDYSAAVFTYESIIGVERGVEINPSALLMLLGITTKAAAGIAATSVGNYELLISEYTSIQIGNTLELSRSTVDYSSNRKYKGGNAAIYVLMAVIAMADLIVVYVIGYGVKENDSSAKITVGVCQGVNAISIVVLHVLEAYGVEAVGVLSALSSQLQQIKSRLSNLVGKNANTADILNPLLTKNRIEALKTIAEKAFINAGTAISTQMAAVAALAQSNPAVGCWVARAVYGPDNPRWILFRQWLFGNGPVPEVRTLLQKLYMRYGEGFARVVDKSPCLRSVLRLLMDVILFLYQKKATGVEHVTRLGSTQ